MKPSMPLRTVAMLLLMCPAAMPQSRDKTSADTPVTVTKTEEQKFDAMIGPCIAITKKTLPEMKKKYVGRQLQGDALYVTIRLADPNGAREAVFVQVKSWEGEIIQGRINNDLRALKTYHRGQTIEVKESEVLDWTFQKPDGTEEGNLIGRQIESPNHDVCK